MISEIRGISAVIFSLLLEHPLVLTLATLLVFFSVLEANAQIAYPIRAIPITSSATGTTGATTATLAGSPSLITHICGFSIRAFATAAATGNATVVGAGSGTMNFTQIVTATPTVGSVDYSFVPCIPSTSINTAISVNSIAPGAGGVVSVTAWGFKLQ